MSCLRTSPGTGGTGRVWTKELITWGRGGKGWGLQSTYHPPLVLEGSAFEIEVLASPGFEVQNKTILTIHVSWCKRTNWNLIRYYHAGGGCCENNCNHVHRWLFWVPFLRCNIAIEASMWFQQLLGGKGVITHHPTVTFTSWSPGFDLCDYSRHQI